MASRVTPPNQRVAPVPSQDWFHVQPGPPNLDAGLMGMRFLTSILTTAETHGLLPKACSQASPAHREPAHSEPQVPVHTCTECSTMQFLLIWPGLSTNVRSRVILQMLSRVGVFVHHAKLLCKSPWTNPRASSSVWIKLEHRSGYSTIIKVQ